MKYLSSEPFSCGPASDNYRKNWDNVFQNPSKSPRLKQNIQIKKKKIEELRKIEAMHEGIYQDMRDIEKRLETLANNYKGNNKNVSQLMKSLWDLQHSINHFDVFSLLDYEEKNNV